MSETIRNQLARNLQILNIENEVSMDTDWDDATEICIEHDYKVMNGPGTAYTNWVETETRYFRIDEYVTPQDVARVVTNYIESVVLSEDTDGTVAVSVVI